jgi:gamma-glutamylcyclotransferase (GGCT)/AIG2-like uncharacterized protein YtfP
MHYLFAHGTLRQGGRNNGLIAGATLLGRAGTVEDYALFIIKNKPVVTKRPVTKIKGEVYSVTEEMLMLIDRFQGHPRINKRELVPVKLEDGSSVDAWIYFHIQPLRDSILVDSGEYIEQKP